METGKLLEELTNAIVKAVPEVSALRRGGKFKYEGKTWVFMRIYGFDGIGQPYIEAMEEGQFERLHPLFHSDGNLPVRLFTNYDFEKFVSSAEPRDPTLEDVLRACFEAGKWVSVTESGKMGRAGMSGGFHPSNTLYGWAFGKPLSEQNNDTIAFLHSLLCQ